MDVAYDSDMSSWWQSSRLLSQEDRKASKAVYTNTQNDAWIICTRNTHKQPAVSNYTRMLRVKPIFSRTNVINIHSFVYFSLCEKRGKKHSTGMHHRHKTALTRGRTRHMHAPTQILPNSGSRISSLTNTHPSPPLCVTTVKLHLLQLCFSNFPRVSFRTPQGQVG